MVLNKSVNKNGNKGASKSPHVLIKKKKVRNGCDANCKGTIKAYLLFLYYYTKTMVINTHPVYEVDTRQKKTIRLSKSE